MSSGKRVFIGIPGQKHTNTAVWDHLLDQLLDPDSWGKHQFKARANPTSGHLDMARTVLLRQGLDWRADYIAQKDADVILEIPTGELMSYLAQDFGAGAGIVFSPTTSIDWKAQFHPFIGKSQAEESYDRPFECDSGAGGFMVTTADVVRKLKTVGIGSYSYGNQSGRMEYTDLLCVNIPRNICSKCGEVTEGVSEDCSLMRNVRESTGLKVVCDPRILTGHLQPIYRPSWRPPEKLNPEALKMVFTPKIYEYLVAQGVLPRAA